MKKKTVMPCIILALVTTTLLVAHPKTSKMQNMTVETVTIVDKGICRKIPVRKSEMIDKRTKNKKVSTFSTQEQQKGLRIRFKKGTEVDIKDFESKYNLKLKARMKIGYYIFENRSKESDVAILAKIIEDEKNIDSIKPNWKMKNSPR